MIAPNGYLTSQTAALTVCVSNGNDHLTIIQLDKNWSRLDNTHTEPARSARSTLQITWQAYLQPASGAHISISHENAEGNMHYKAIVKHIVEAAGLWYMAKDYH